MKEIPLTQDKVAIVDDGDFEWLNQWKWHAHRRHGIWYALRGIVVAKKPVAIRMHRMILDAPIGVQVDHINGDGLRNTRDNLRLVTDQQNRFNGRLYANNTSGYKGVSLFRPTGKWCAHIGFNGKRKNLGYFGTPEEAASAYDNAARKLFGEFARLNFRETAK